MLNDAVVGLNVGLMDGCNADLAGNWDSMREIALLRWLFIGV